MNSYSVEINYFWHSSCQFFLKIESVFHIIHCYSQSIMLNLSSLKDELSIVVVNFVVFFVFSSFHTEESYPSFCLMYCNKIELSKAINKIMLFERYVVYNNNIKL